MKYTSAWRDFEIIATGDGEKLERWGNVILLRPDPQAIWKPSLDYATYPQISGHYLRSSTGGGSWQWLKPTPDEWTIKYKNLSFIISPMNFKHTGLFPEQAVNWDYMIDKIKSMMGEHPRMFVCLLLLILLIVVFCIYRIADKYLNYSETVSENLSPVSDMILVM